MQRSRSRAKTRIAAGSIVGLVILASLISLFALYYATQRDAIQEQASIERQVQQREEIKNEIRNSVDTIYYLNGTTLTINTTSHYTQTIIYWGLLIYFGHGQVYILTDKNMTGEGTLATLQKAQLITPNNTISKTWNTASDFQNTLPLPIPPGHTLTITLQVSTTPTTIKAVVGVAGIAVSSLSYKQATPSFGGPSPPPTPPSSQLLYRTPVTITYTGTGVSKEGIVLLELDPAWPGWDNVASDGSDIYVTDWNGKQLPHQILRWDYTGKTALIAVETPPIPSWQPLTIYIYYGPNSPGYTGGIPSILLWDDFIGTTLNTSKWNTNAAGFYNVSNSILSLWGRWNENHVYINTQSTFTAPFYIYVKGLITVPGSDSDLAVIASSAPDGYVWYSSTSTKTVVTYKIDDEDSGSQRWKWNEIYVSSSDYTYDNTYNPATISNVWVLIQAYYTTNTVWMYDNATQRNLTLTPAITLAPTVHLGLAGDTDSNTLIDKVDYILATKKPLINISQSIGNEEVYNATLPAPRPGDVWPGDLYNYSYSQTTPQKPGYLLFDDFSDGNIDWAETSNTGFTATEDPVLGSLLITVNTATSGEISLTRYLASSSNTVVIDALVGGHLDSGDGSLLLYRTIALRASGANDLAWYVWDGFTWNYIADSNLEDTVGRVLIIADNNGNVNIYENGVYLGSYTYTSTQKLDTYTIEVRTDSGGQFRFRVDQVKIYTNTSIAMTGIPANNTVTMHLQDSQSTNFDATFANLSCGSGTPSTIYVSTAQNHPPSYTLIGTSIQPIDPTTIWTHKIPVTITASTWPLQNLPIVVKINFTGILESLGDTTGIIDPDSIRVIDPGGTLIDYNMTWNNQFNPSSPTHDNAWGWLVFKVNIPAGSSATYTIYFTTQDNPRNPPTTTLNIAYAKSLTTTTGEIPDQYYYPLKTSLDYFIPWVDNGGPTIISGDDRRTSQSLGFSFPYYGTTYSTVNVVTNGFLIFDSSTTDYSDSVGELIYRKMIAAFWDDLYVRSGEYIERIDESYYGLSTVRFHYYVSYYRSSTDYADFAVTLFSNGIVVVQWNRIDLTDSYTLGISNGAGISGQYIIPYSSTDPSYDQDIFPNQNYLVGKSLVFLPQNLYTYTFGTAEKGCYLLP